MLSSGIITVTTAVIGLKKSNIAKAKKFVAQALEQIEEMLALNPAIGRAGRILGTREFVISKYPYILPYQVKENTIYILRVLHTSRKWE